MFGFGRREAAPETVSGPSLPPLNRNIQRMQFGRVHTSPGQQAAMQRRIDVSAALAHTYIASGGPAPTTGIGETVRRQRMIHSISGQTSIPPEHLHGLPSIHYGSPETVPQGAYAYMDKHGEGMHLAEGPADARNARQRADFGGMFAHELGHHVEAVEKSRGAETGVMSHSMHEARAENYAAKYAPGHTNSIYDEQVASGHTSWNFDNEPYKAERNVGTLPGQPRGASPDPRVNAKRAKGWRSDTRESQKSLYPGQESRVHPEGKAERKAH